MWQCIKDNKKKKSSSRKLQGLELSYFACTHVAMYKGHLYKSCQLCPWGRYRPCPRGIITYHRLILEIHEKSGTGLNIYDSKKMDPSGSFAPTSWQYTCTCILPSYSSISETAWPIKVKFYMNHFRKGKPMCT